MNEPASNSKRPDMIQTVYAAVEEVLRRLKLTNATGHAMIRIDASNGSPTNVRIVTDESFKLRS